MDQKSMGFSVDARRQAGQQGAELNDMLSVFSKLMTDIESHSSKR
jgi:hypothetical protein